ncbi:response regulator transcription factor [Candidatus Allofournierella excrementigallinarum]|uniref:response regulator transcription factor n=1 Tax=Candidatus Allofournierella excrementigallinarum TaxID=2838592 RepID=UPI00374FD6AB
MRILLIEDDEALRAVLVPVLEKAGFGCDEAADGASGLALLLQNPYDAAVVDRMLPALSGLELVRAARRKGCAVPVLMLTALGRVEDRVEGLGAGADDYLVKPFDNRELIARLQALGRRPARTLESALLRFCDVSLDAAALTLTGPAGTARLSRNENALLEALLRRAGQLVSREVLFCAVWGAEDFVEEGNLDSYIHFVRRRLSTVGSRAVIRTVRGMGYCLEAGGDAP